MDYGVLIQSVGSLIGYFRVQLLNIAMLKAIKTIQFGINCYIQASYVIISGNKIYALQLWQ